MSVREALDADLAGIAALKVNSWEATYGPLLGSEVVDPMLDVQAHRRAIDRVLESCSTSRRRIAA